MLVVIPVSTGETFTAYADSIGAYVVGQKGITLEQLKVLGEENDVHTDIDDQTPTDRYLWLVDEVGYYSFDELAIVDESKLDIITAASDAISGGDSASQFEMFNRVVIAAAETTIPFYNEGVIEIDPDY